MKIKIEKISDKFGTRIYLSSKDKSKYVEIEEEFTFKQIEMVEESINKLLSEINNK